jgi:hypothetical protein
MGQFDGHKTNEMSCGTCFTTYKDWHSSHVYSNTTQQREFWHEKPKESSYFIHGTATCKDDAHISTLNCSLPSFVTSRVRDRDCDVLGQNLSFQFPRTVSAPHDKQPCVLRAVSFEVSQNNFEERNACSRSVWNQVFIEPDTTRK